MFSSRKYVLDMRASEMCIRGFYNEGYSLKQLRKFLGEAWEYSKRHPNNDRPRKFRT